MGKGIPGSAGFKYSGSDDLEKVAWFEKNSHYVHEVGLKQPNELGVYDISGNLWEWCSDWHGYYSSDSQTNPEGPELGPNRVFRGGSWYADAGHCRASHRNDNTPGTATTAAVSDWFPRVHKAGMPTLAS